MSLFILFVLGFITWAAIRDHDRDNRKDME
jgi:hypothetical protein